MRQISFLENQQRRVSTRIRLHSNQKAGNVKRRVQNQSLNAEKLNPVRDADA